MVNHYTKKDIYKCEICGKEVKKWGKWRHENGKYHKLLKFYKLKVNQIIAQSQLNSDAKV